MRSQVHRGAAADTPPYPTLSARRDAHTLDEKRAGQAFVKTTFEVISMLTKAMYLGLILGSTSCATHAATRQLASATSSQLVWPNIKFGDYRGSLGPKVVALTFEDGPDVKGTHTHKILNISQ